VAKESQKFGVTVDTLQGPMYMRGVKELTAEKEELEKRKDDEPFIAGFRDKQESLAQLDAGLEQLHAARASVHAVTVDQPAIQGKSPVKPRRMRVLAVSLVLGGIIGILVAFVVNFAQLQKAKN
jgi:LPS O-antigen subunit length determinant protein (WzzB/FepE family)